MNNKNLLVPVLLLFLTFSSLPALAAGELVRGVRMKISAGDLASAEAMVEDHARDVGKDAEYLNGLSWLARGAQLLGQDDRALELAQQVRQQILFANDDNLLALGAAVEVEAKVLAKRKGKVAALEFLADQRQRSTDPAYQSRLWKNVNYLNLEGQKAPEIVAETNLGPEWQGLDALKGKPVVLFLWAHWCSDCKAQAVTLAKVRKEFADQGVVFVAPTRFYGRGKDDAAATPEEEKKQIAAVLAENYQDLGPISVPISTEAMLRYGASATPSFVFIDRAGVVSSYTATRLTEKELTSRIEKLLPKH